MDPELARLRDELSAAIAHRCALQEALSTAEGERDALAAEERRLRSRFAEREAEIARLHAHTADLHGALNVARERVDPSPPPRIAAASPAADPPRRLRALPDVPVIEVRDLCKSYRLPSRPAETLKERFAHPLRSARTIQLDALREVSFDVHRGEFLGIAGPNGSGKSTLLKLLANVYGADSGTIRTAGRVAPFIELGVGLNPEFAAYDNVVISGVMMGLEPKQARDRFPAIIEFAGLRDFTELKLKNYSSGMRVRLAFAVMAQVDADILLIDEVLAVGDAEFREKCLARLDELRGEGKTIVLVTHGMDTIAKQCDRGILLRDGRVVADGDPAEVVRRYAQAPPAPAQEAPEIRLVTG